MGDPELAGDGESGDSAEPVVGVDEVPVRAAPVRGVPVCAERFPQCGAEGRDRLLHRALGQRRGGTGVEVVQP